MAAPPNILEALRQQKVLEKVLVPPFLATLLETFKVDDITPLPPAAEQNGHTTLAVERELSGSSLNLVVPLPQRAFSIIYEGPAADPTGFVVAISLNEGPAKPVLDITARRGRSRTDACDPPAVG